jgi:hypothetical protein
MQLSSVGRAVFVISAGAGAIASFILWRWEPGVIGAAVGLYFLFSIRVVKQWERWPCCASADSSECASRECFL